MKRSERGGEKLLPGTWYRNILSDYNFLVVPPVHTTYIHILVHTTLLHTHTRMIIKLSLGTFVLPCVPVIVIKFYSN